MVTTTPVDLTQRDELALAARIGQAWIELRRGAAMSALRDHLFGAGEDALEPGQVDTLDLLVKRPSWRMSELAEALRVDPSTATRAVQRLLRAGLADRAASADDGRVVMVSATPAGVARHGAIAARRRQFLATMMGAFEPDDRRKLADLLEQMVAAVDDFVAKLDD